LPLFRWHLFWSSGSERRLFQGGFPFGHNNHPAFTFCRSWRQACEGRQLNPSGPKHNLSLGSAPRIIKNQPSIPKKLKSIVKTAVFFKKRLTNRFEKNCIQWLYSRFPERKSFFRTNKSMSKVLSTRVFQGDRGPAILGVRSTPGAPRGDGPDLRFRRQPNRDPGRLKKLGPNGLVRNTPFRGRSSST